MHAQRGHFSPLFAALALVVCTDALGANSGFAASPHAILGPNLTARDVAPATQTRRSRAGDSTLSWVTHWNHVAIDASARDHTPPRAEDAYTHGAQLGPGRTSRALAIVQIAVFEAMNAIEPRYPSYIGLAPVGHGRSLKAAIAQASHDALAALYPSQRSSFDAELQQGLKQLRAGPAVRMGRAVGARAAKLILQKRSGDHAQHAEPRVGVEYVPSNAPGVWRQDPVSEGPFALGAHWGKVLPFVLESSAQFRTPPPPALSSAEYAAAFDQVKRLGGDGVVTPTERTAEQSEIGLYWAYDGTPGLGAPPRLYNQILLAIAAQMKTNAFETARLLALANVAMADAGIAIWESKYHYQVWRPITAIREADEGSGPSGAGDGNPYTLGDPTFMPLGAPASNLEGPNFTPPFPAYPSGHAGFGAAVFHTLRRFYRTDAIAFTFVSDELNGLTHDNHGNVRPLRPRSFKSLSAAEEENARSRVYLGIHWAFDASEGITQGQQVSDYVFDRLYARVKPR